MLQAGGPRHPAVFLPTGPRSFDRVNRSELAGPRVRADLGDQGVAAMGTLEPALFGSRGCEEGGSEDEQAKKYPTPRMVLM